MNSKINQGAMLPVGSMLRGIYRIESYLSSGGFGNTYVATHVEFEETVAIKEFFMRGVTERDANNTTVSVSNSDNRILFQEQLQKFKKEAKRLWRLKNQHIVSVHDLFEENGTAYYVMDYIDGENLSEKLKRQLMPLSETEVTGYLPQILDALSCVHNEGLWHLDLKPANIMVDRVGNVTLIDFGASKQRSSHGGATTSTAVSYTNGFAPREQMEQNLEKFGPWTDLYALGATLYNLLTNRKPPMPSDIDDDRSADKHLALPFPGSVSEKTKQIILRLLTTDRLDRPQSVTEVRELLERKPMGTRKVVEATKMIDTGEKTVVIGKTTRVPVSSPITPASPEPKSIKPSTEKPKQISSGYKGPEKPKMDEKEPEKNNHGLYFSIFIFSLLAIISLSLRFCSPSYDANVDEAAPSEEEVGGSTSNDIDSIADAVAAAVDSVAAAAAEAVSAGRLVGYSSNKLGNYKYKGGLNERNLPNGIGQATFDNGNIYKGPFINGIMEGEKAVYIFRNGDVFEGSFKNDEFYYGKYTVAQNGEYFIGSYKNGNPFHGKWYDKADKVVEEI